jgi:chromosome segregation ATPase
LKTASPQSRSDWLLNLEGACSGYGGATVGKASRKWGVNEWASTAKVEQSLQTLRAQNERLSSECGGMHARSVAAELRVRALEDELAAKDEETRSRLCQQEELLRRKEEVLEKVTRRVRLLEQERSHLAALVEEERAAAAKVYLHVSLSVYVYVYQTIYIY